MRSVRAAVSLLALFSCLVVIAPLKAQTVAGTIKDGDTGQPIADASVVLLDKNGRVQRGTLTELDGSFTLVAPDEGAYTVRVGAAGFETRDTPPLKLVREEARELEILLRSEGQSGPGAGFAERMKLGRGIFLTRDMIRERSATRFTDVLRFTAGVSVVPLPSGEHLSAWTSTPGFSTSISVRDEAVPTGRQQYNTIRVKANADFKNRNVGAVQHGEAADDCPPVLWVDGLWWGSIDDASPGGPDLALIPDNVEAIEIYNHPSILPDQFNSGPDALCGVVVVWTRR